MSNDERPDSLAAQAAAWVPPWERQLQPPDRAYQAEAEEAARAEAEEAARFAAEQADADPLDADLTDEVADDERDLTEIDELAAAPAPAGAAAPGPAPAPAGAPAPAPAGAPAPAPAGAPAPAPAGAGAAAPSENEGEQIAHPSGEADHSEISDDEPASEFEALPDQDGKSEMSNDPASPDSPTIGDISEMSDEPTASSELPALDDESEIPAELDPAVGDKPEISGIGGAPDEAEPPVLADESEMSVDETTVADEVPAEFGAAPAGGAQGRTKTGSAVPEQGRRRRSGAGAAGAVHDGGGDEAGAGESGDERTAAGVGVEGDLPGLSDDEEFAAALEAILLVVDEPVGEMQLAQILEQPTERVGAMLEDISARYTAAGHGFDLRRAAGGWRLYTRPEYAAYVERFVLDGQSVRLTQAALETLAVVAYKQPVTRSRISAIRGVNCDGVMRTLVTRGLIEECGTESETGAYLYRTTALFLEKLGLNSVEQLPPLAPFLPDDVEEVLDAPG